MHRRRKRKANKRPIQRRRKLVMSRKIETASRGREKRVTVRNA